MKSYKGLHLHFLNSLSFLIGIVSNHVIAAIYFNSVAIAMLNDFILLIGTLIHPELHFPKCMP